MKNELILFLPNGLGDTILMSFVINTLPEGTIKKIVTLSPIHSELIQTLSRRKIETLERFDGRRFPQARLFLKLLLSRERTILAPLLSKKKINYFFFLFLFGKKILVPAQFTKAKLGRFQLSRFNINTFSGHWVNYLSSFFDPPMPEILPRQCNIKEKSNVYKIAIGLSCGRAEQHKIPRPEWFANVIRILQSSSPQIEVLLIGSLSDKPLIGEFERHLGSDIPIRQRIGLPLKELIEELKTCDIGLAGTTGQSHMMSLANIPQAIVCGVTNPYESGPFIDTAVLIKHNFPCGPCYQDGFTFGCKKFPCMDSIDTELAAKQIQSLLRDTSSYRGWHKDHQEKTKTLPEITKALIDLERQTVRRSHL